MAKFESRKFTLALPNNVASCPLPFQNSESNMISAQEWHCFSSSGMNWVAEKGKKKIMDSTISCQKSFLLLSFCFYCSLWIHFFKSKNPSLKAQYSIPKTHPLFRPWKPVPLTELAAKMAKPVDPDGHLSNGWRVGWVDGFCHGNPENGNGKMIRWMEICINHADMKSVHEWSINDLTLTNLGENLAWVFSLHYPWQEAEDDLHCVSLFHRKLCAWQKCFL